MISNFSCELTPLVGSSINSRLGDSANATAISTSLRTPSGSEPIWRAACGSRPKMANSSSASSRAGLRYSEDSVQNPSRAASASNRFSSTDCSENNCGSWNVRAMPRRVIARGASRVKSWSPKRTLPCVGRT